MGKALNQHVRTIIFREEGKQNVAMTDRLAVLLGTEEGFNRQSGVWRLKKRGQQIEFGSLKDPGSERGYQGRPHDLLAYDEVTNVRKAQVIYLSAWRRSNIPGQRCETLMTMNPPSDSAGRWVLEYFYPWLEKKDAGAGEIRWFVTVDQNSIEVDDDRPCVILNNEPVFDFDPADYQPTKIIHPVSRTFIASKVTDNRYYLGDHAYMSTLQSMPEPYRSMLLEGDFSAGIEDSEWQVIPTEWVLRAQERWSNTPMLKKPPMTGMGVDVARGGRDNTILARKHEGLWFDEPLVYPGAQTPDGHTVMALIVAALRDRAPAQVDIVGIGSSPYDFLKIARFQVVGFNGGEKSNETTRPGTQGFANRKSAMWWHMRELLDPDYNTGICLPPDKQLLKDLTAPVWQPEGSKIRVESRRDIIKRIGRSPDWGSAYVYAAVDVPRRDYDDGQGAADYDPFSIFEG